MIVLNKLILDNFLSIEHIEYRFLNGVPVLIKGKNKTDRSQKSNGSGKSAFQSAIQFIIESDISRKVNDKKLIRWGCDKAIVKLVLTQTKGNIKYEIERTINKKGSSTISILENGVAIEKATVLDYNKWIFSNIFTGISKDDMNKYYLLSELTYKPFFLSSDREKKEVLSAFSNVDLINSIPEKIILEQERISKEISKLDESIANKESFIELREGDIEKEKNRDLDEEFNQQKEAIQFKISSQEKSIEECKEKITLEKSSILNTNKKLEELKAEISELVLDVEDGEEYCKEVKTTLQTLNEKVEKNEESKDKLETEKREVKRKLTLKEASLSRGKAIEKGVIVCPNCKFEFLLDSEIPIEEVRKSILKLEKDIKTESNFVEEIALKITNIKESFKGELSKVDEKKSEVKKATSLLDEITEELSSKNKNLKSFESILSNTKENIKDLEAKIERTEKLILSYKEELKGLVKGSVVDKIKELKKEIAGFQKEIKGFEKQKAEFAELFGKENHWQVNFINFKNYLINRQLKVIQNLINERLEEMNSDLKVSIEGFKVLANGTVKENITPLIIKEGEEKDYGSLSKGERTKVDMSVVVVLQDLINQSAQCGGFDFLGSDETIEGLDDLGLENLLNSMKNLNKTIMITTHNGEEIVYEPELTLIKENGITKILE